MSDLTDKQKAGCLKASIAIVGLILTVPLYAYVWIRLFTLANATAGDFMVFWLYIAVAVVFGIGKEVVSVITNDVD